MSSTKFTDTARTPVATSKVAGELTDGSKGHFLVSALKTFFGIGTTTNDNAAAGQIGEFIESEVVLAGAVSLTTGVSANVTSISLTAGDWDVSGNVYYNSAAGTTITGLGAAISLTSATYPLPRPGRGAFTTLLATFTGNGSANLIPAGTVRMSVASTTTVYLVANGSFAASTLTAGGYIGARRAR